MRLLKKNGPSYLPDGPMLKFEVLGDRNNFIDVPRSRLEIVPRIVQNNGSVLRTHATEIAHRDTHAWLKIYFHLYFPNALSP